MNKFNIMKNIIEVRKAILFIIFVIFIITITSSCSSISDTQNDIPSNTYPDIDTKPQIETTVQPQVVIEHTYGNTYQNISLGNNIVSWRSKIYYLQYSLMENHNDLSKSVSYKKYLENELTDSYVRNLNVYNDELYFIQKGRIIKMDKSSKLELIYTDANNYDLWNMAICNDRIMFSNYIRGRVISIHLDGSDYREILNKGGGIINFIVYEGNIYAAISKSDGSHYSDYILCSDVLGENQTKIAVQYDMSESNFQIYNDTIYYFEAYKEADLKGTQKYIYLMKSDFNANVTKVIKLGEKISDIFFINQDGIMFFYDENTYKIMSLDLDTQILKSFASVEPSVSGYQKSFPKFYGYIDDYVYFTVGGSLCRTDGNVIEELNY